MIGQEGQGHNALNTFGIQLLVLRMHQGRAGELEGVVRASIEAYPDLPSWRTALVIIGVSTNDKALLREAYEPLAINDFGASRATPCGTPRWPCSLPAAASLADVPGSARLYELLAPLSGRNVHIGAGAVYLGSIDLYLARLARSWSGGTSLNTTSSGRRPCTTPSGPGSSLS